MTDEERREWCQEEIRGRLRDGVWQVTDNWCREFAVVAMAHEHEHAIAEGRRLERADVVAFGGQGRSAVKLLSPDVADSMAAFLECLENGEHVGAAKETER